MSEPPNTTIVGFDLGHGETAVALAQSNKTTPPQVVDLPGAAGRGRQHVSAVTVHPERGVLLGEAAVDAQGSGRLYLNFKSPMIDRDEVSLPTRLLVDKIREDVTSAGIIPARGRRRWVFGSPSGWSVEVRRSYAKLLRTAGLETPDVSVEVIPESRAALLYARDSGEVVVEQNQLSGTVLIIDIGSSTTDFTVVAGRQTQPPVDSGTQLGANLIDKLILRWAIAVSPFRAQLEALLDANPDHQLRLELTCRRAKEEFFQTDPEQFVANPDSAVTRARLVLIGGAKVHFTVDLTAAVMRELLSEPIAELGGQSWPEAYRAALVAVADTIPTRPDVVLLTGGASRMRFVQEITRRMFGAGRMVVGAEPEMAIARGLALAGRMGVRTAGFRQDVRRLIDGDRINTLVANRLPDLAKAMGEAAVDGMTERHVIPAFRRWRNGKIGTLNELADGVAAAIRDELTGAGNPKLTAVVAKWQNELRPGLEQLTRPICNRWYISPAAMMLPPVALRAEPDGLALAPSTSAATDVFDNIAKTVATLVLAGLAAAWVGSTAGVVVTTGPIGLLVAAVVVTIGLAMGRQALVDRAASGELPLWLRQLRREDVMVQKLRDGAAAKEAELGSQLAEQFLTYNRDALARDIAAALALQLEAQAADAELLIS